MLTRGRTRRAQRFEREVQRGRLVALGLGERGRRHQPAAPDHPSSFAHRPGGIVGELERVEADHRVEARVIERQVVHPADAEVPVRHVLTRDRDQLRGDVDPRHQRAEAGGHVGGVARAAADVEQSRARAHAEPAQHFGEQRLVRRLGQLRPVARTSPPVL